MSELPTVVDPIRKGWTSASNALADSLCPGRHLAQRGLREVKANADAVAGDRIHQALAYDSVKGRGIQPTNLTLEERELFDQCRDIEKKLIRQFFGDDYPAMRVFRHERLWVTIQGPNGPIAHSGEPDTLFRSGMKGLIVDYKTGWGDVADSPRNMQLRDLAILTRGNHVSVSEVATAIVQPSVTESPEICVYTGEDLAKAEALMFSRVVASNDPNAPRVAGELQCKFCLAKAHCAEYQQFASQITPPQMLSVMGVPMVNWTPEQRKVALSAVSAARKLCDEIEEFCKDGLARDPGFVPGWRLKPGSIREAIKDPEQVFTRFVALGGKSDAFMRAVIIQKKALREELNKLTGAKGQALDKAMDAICDGLVTKKQTAPSLETFDDL